MQNSQLSTKRRPDVTNQRSNSEAITIWPIEGSNNIIVKVNKFITVPRGEGPGNFIGRPAPVQSATLVLRPRRCGNAADDDAPYKLPCCNDNVITIRGIIAKNFTVYILS